MAAGSAILVGVGSLGAVADDLIRSKDIVDDTVRSKDVNDGTLRSKDVRKNALKKGDIRRNAVGGSELIDGSIKEKELSDDVLALLNQAGVPGPQGEVGPMGPVGPRGPAGDAASDRLGALVDHDRGRVIPEILFGENQRTEAPLAPIAVDLPSPGTYLLQASGVSMSGFRPSLDSLSFLALITNDEVPIPVAAATGTGLPVVDLSQVVSVNEPTQVGVFGLTIGGDVISLEGLEGMTVTVSAVRVSDGYNDKLKPGAVLPDEFEDMVREPELLLGNEVQ